MEAYLGKNIEPYFAKLLANPHSKFDNSAMCAYTTWGAGKETLLTLYNEICQSVVNYAARVSLRI